MQSELGSCLATGEDSKGELPPVPPRRGGIRLHLRVSCIVVVLIFMATYLSPFATPALAASGNNVHISKGMRVVENPNGSRAVSFLPTFQKWDGTHQLLSSLDFSSGSWPFLIQQSPTTLTVTHLGKSFTQAKIPGASYEVSPTRIKETIKIPDRNSVPTGKISTALTSTYGIQLYGLSAQLLNASGAVTWETAGFLAWDSSSSPNAYPVPVTDLVYQSGVLTLVLNATMLARATYPLYLDPTWVLKADANNNWAGTLDNLTSDWGDHRLKIGSLADNFDGNINSIWTVEYGNFSVSGGRGVLGPPDSSIKTSGSWTDLWVSSTINFNSGTEASLRFRYGPYAYYYLKISYALGFIRLGSWAFLGGIGYISPPINVTINAGVNYSVAIKAKGNNYEIWWNGALKWRGSDSGSAGSGGISFTTVGSTTKVYLDNVRVWSVNKTSGNYTSPVRDAGTSNIPTQIGTLGSADGNNSMDLRINSSADNITWGGWHLIKSVMAPGYTYSIPDADQRRYYRLWAAFRTWNTSTPALGEIDVSERPPLPPSLFYATTNTGRQPWHFYVGGMVNAISGNLFYSSTDLSIRAKGFSIAISRAYNSGLSTTAGPFGLGTTHSLNAKLMFDPWGNVTLNDGDGAFYTFTTLGGNFYSPPRGLHYHLVQNIYGPYVLWRPDGSRMDFDSTGGLTAVRDKNNNRLTLTYTSGQLTQVGDGSGLSLTLTYDGSNRVKDVTDPMGRRVTYTYDASNRLTQFKDAMGYTTNYSYDGTSGRMAIILDPAGGVTHVLYNGNQTVTEVRRGNWSFTSGSIKWEFRAYALNYVSGSQTDVTDARGSVTHVTFNSLGNPTYVSGPAVGNFGGAGNSTGYAWDGEFDPLSITDGRGNTVANTYDWLGNLLTSKDPGGNTTARTFNIVWSPFLSLTGELISLLTSSTNPRGYTTTYGYDAAGNLVTTKDAGGNTSTNYYDAAGYLIQAKDFRGNSVKYGYDSHEFLINATDAGGNVTTFQNDLIGRRWNVTTPGGNTSRTVLDGDDRVNKTIDPMGNVTTYNYNNRGELVKIRDANLLVTQYAINITLGRTQKYVDAGGNFTTYVYNNTGELIQVTDAKTHTTAYGYDIYHRQITSTSPLGYVAKSGYDAAGNGIWRLDANGNKTNYYYDRSNRLVKTVYPNGQVLTVTYDKNGNIVNGKGLELEEKYTYDKLDRVTATKQIFLVTILTLYHNYTYDADGNRLTMSGDGGGNYTWDKSNRLYARTDNKSRRWTFRFDKDGHQTRVTLPDGENTTYVYNRNGWLLNTTTKRSDGGLLEFFSYTYDKVGNQLSMREYRVYQSDHNASYGRPCSLSNTSCSQRTADTHPSGLSPSPQTVTVSLRIAGSTWCGTAGCTPGSMTVTFTLGVRHNGVVSTINLGTQTVNPGFDVTKTASVQLYSGDALYGQITYPVTCKNFFGNCLPMTDVITSIKTTWYSAYVVPATYAYDREYRIYKTIYADGSADQSTYDAVGNRLTRTIGGSTISYTYDSDDRLTSSSDGWTLTYDASGSLRTKAKSGQTTTYGYDYENRLTSVTLPGNTVVKYGYSSGGLRTSRNVSSKVTYYGYDLVGLGGPSQVTGEYAGSLLAAQNAYGPGTDNSLERIQNGSAHFYHRDGAGSITSITNETNQAIESSYRYDSLGAQTQAGGSVSNPYRYTAREWDSTSGLNYHRARYYDPTVGRFISKDPAGMVDGTDLYAYAGNNPVRFTDPSGNCIAGPGVSCGSQKYFQSGFYCPSCPDESSSASSSVNNVEFSSVHWDQEWWGKCGPDWALFIFGAVAGLVGIGLNWEDFSLKSMVFDALTSYAPDIWGMMKSLAGVAAGDFSGLGLAIGQFVIDVGAHLWERLLGLLIHSIWDAMIVGLGIVTDFVPGILPGKLVVWLASSTVNLMSIANEGCFSTPSET